MRRKSGLRMRTEGTAFELGKRRAIVLEYSPDQPELISVRAAGLKTRYSITTGDLYTLLVQRAVEAERRTRRRTR